MGQKQKAETIKLAFMRMVTVREDEKGLKMEGLQIDNTIGGRCGIYKHIYNGILFSPEGNLTES